MREFFDVMMPAEIDALDKATKKQSAHYREQIKHLRQEATRLEYAATRAERKYNNVDPENRLIAANLEKKWEHALADLELAKSKLSEMEETKPQNTKIPLELRAAFSDVGQQLPELWPRLSVEAKRSMICVLVKQINLLRDIDGIGQIRIVWRGDLVTEVRTPIPVRSLHNSDMEKQIVKTVRQMTAHRSTVEQIIDTLNNHPDLYPCRGGEFTPQIVNKLKNRHRIVTKSDQLRKGLVELKNAYTIQHLSEIIEIDPSWFRKIRKGAIRITKDAIYGCYVRAKEAIGKNGEADLRRTLRNVRILGLSDLIPQQGGLTDYELDLLSDIVDARYSHRLPTWLSLNVGKRSEAEERMGVPIVDRLGHDALTLHCNWESFRGRSE